MTFREYVKEQGWRKNKKACVNVTYYGKNRAFVGSGYKTLNKQLKSFGELEFVEAHIGETGGHLIISLKREL